MLQKAGGSFILTADVDFGDNFGLIATYFTSDAVNPATVGTIRLASADAGISFRNNANSGNLTITTDASDNLLYNGNIIAASASNITPVSRGGTGDSTLMAFAVLTGGTSSTSPVQSVASVGLAGQVLTSNGAGVLPTFQNTTGTGTVNSGTINQLAYYAATGSTISGLTAITINRALVSNASGLPIASVTTDAELAFSSGVTSAIQTQLNAKVASVSGTTNQITSTGGTTPVLAIANPVTFPGAMTAGGALAMGANKITNLASGTISGDAVQFSQLPGPAGTITNWTSYTPSSVNGFGSTTNNAFFSRRVGDTLSVRGAFKCGTTVASRASFSIPTGLSIDFTKLPSSVSNSQQAGLYATSQAGSLFLNSFAGLMISDGSTVGSLFFTVSGSNGNGYASSNGNDVAATGNYVTFQADVPIVGWTI